MAAIGTHAAPCGCVFEFVSGPSKNDGDKVIVTFRPSLIKACRSHGRRKRSIWPRLRRTPGGRRIGPL